MSITLIIFNSTSGRLTIRFRSASPLYPGQWDPVVTSSGDPHVQSSLVLLGLHGVPTQVVLPRVLHCGPALVPVLVGVG